MECAMTAAVMSRSAHWIACYAHERDSFPLVVARWALAELDSRFRVRRVAAPPPGAIASSQAEVAPYLGPSRIGRTDPSAGWAGE